MSKRYMYIANGHAMPEDTIDCFRLITKKELNSMEYATTAVRVDVTGITLHKCSCDPYYTTSDTRTLDYHEYTPFVKKDGKWVPAYSLKGHMPCDWSDMLLKDCGLVPYKNHGFVSKVRYSFLVQEATAHNDVLLELADKCRESYYRHEHELERLDRDDLLFLCKELLREEFLKNRSRREPV